MSNVAGSISIPSKTFLIGEYAVLKGASSLVLMHPPYFQAKAENSNQTQYHEKSPAGKILKSINGESFHRFIDPYQGGGGFGGSTAEVVSVLKFNKKYCDLTPGEAFNLYMNQFKEFNVKPSGADFYGQWVGVNKGPYVLEFNKILEKCQIMEWPFKDISVQILKRKEKINTHEHLEKLNLKSEEYELLIEASNKACESFKKGSDNFFKDVNTFTEIQNHLGLLGKEVYNELDSIKNVKGVVTARGCGALGADVIAIFTDETFTINIDKDSSFSNLKYVYSLN